MIKYMYIFTTNQVQRLRGLLVSSLESESGSLGLSRTHGHLVFLSKTLYTHSVGTRKV